MRYALVTTSYPVASNDSAGHFVRAEARSLARSGHDVWVLAPEGMHVTDPGVLTVPLPHFGLFGHPGALERMKREPWLATGLLPFVVAAQRALRRLEPLERVVAHWVVPALWPIAHRTNARIEVVAHGSDVSLLERVPGWARARVLRALDLPNVEVRCVSADLARRLMTLANDRAYHLKAKLRVAPCPIDIPEIGDPRQLRRKWGIGNVPLVVVGGRLVPSKGVEQALEAGSMLEGARLAVLGDGPLRITLQNRYPEALWLGHLPRTEALTWIRAADLVLLASREEGAPTMVREARAMDTDVVCLEVADLRVSTSTDPGLHLVSTTEPERGQTSG